jgi:hypothetical protein
MRKKEAEMPPSFSQGENVSDPIILREWRTVRNLTRKEAGLVFRVNERIIEGLEYGRFPNSPLWGPISQIIYLIQQKEKGEGKLLFSKKKGFLLSKNSP